MANYTNPFTGEPLSEEKIQEISARYGSYENWIASLKKNATTRGMLATDPKAKGGDKKAREIMADQAASRTGAGMKVADAAFDALHYLPATQAAMDVADIVMGDEPKSNVMSAIGGTTGKLADGVLKGARAAQDYTEEFAGTLLKGAATPGKVYGVVDDVANSVSLARDIAKTPNKDYQSRYFGRKKKKEPTEPTPDNPWMLPE